MPNHILGCISIFNWHTALSLPKPGCIWKENGIVAISSAWEHVKQVAGSRERVKVKDKNIICCEFFFLYSIWNLLRYCFCLFWSLEYLIYFLHFILSLKKGNVNHFIKILPFDSSWFVFLFAICILQCLILCMFPWINSLILELK